jgi:hypothetical protein
MSFAAKVFTIMTASPSDVPLHRNHVRDEVFSWNDVHARHRSTMLMPLGWEHSMAPEMGGSPQDIVNARLLDDADLLVAIFQARLGTPTKDHESGSVEEVKTHLARGRPTMVYFSTDLGPSARFDPEQYMKLQDFKKWCMENGICHEFTSDTDFRVRFNRHLPQVLNQHPYFSNGSPNVNGGAGEPIGPNPPSPAPKAVSAPPASEASSKATSASLVVEFSSKNKKKAPGAELEMDILKRVAADASGVLLVVETLEGVHYQVNNDEINKGMSMRERKMLEETIDSLELKGLLKLTPHGGKGARIYEITAAGFRAADEAQESTN